MYDLEDFARTTTFHGISLIPSSSAKWSRLSWLLILFAAVGMFVNQTVSAVQEYINAPVAIEVTMVRNSTLVLPVVVICPTRGLNVYKMVNENLSGCLIDKIMDDYGSTNGWQHMNNNTTCNSTTMEDELSSFMQQNNISDFKDFLQRYALDISDFIFNIRTPNGNNINSTALKANQMQIFGGFDAAICWTFNTSESVVFASISSGLVIFLQQPPRTKYDLQHSDSWMIGLTQNIVNSPPNYYVRLSPNSMVDIDLTVAIINRLQDYSWPKTADLCDSNPTHVSSEVSHVKMFLQAVLFTCGCLHFKEPYRFRLNVSQPTCTPFQLDSCFQTKYPKFINLVAELQSKIKPVCYEKMYSMSSTYAGLEPSVVQRSYSIPANNSVGVVRLSYSRMVYTSYRSFESVTLTTVVSNLGGQLGLWLGASVISVIHLFSWVPYWIGSSVNGAKKKQSGIADAPVQSRY